MHLWEFVNNADWLNRLIPTFDDVRFSFPRLVAAGYLDLSHDRNARLKLKGTDAAFDLRDRVQASTLGGVLGGLASMVEAQPYPSAEEEDQSLGPLDGFERTEWDAAVTRNADWMTGAVRRFLPGFTAPGSSRDIRER